MRVPPMPVWFLMVVREWVPVTYLVISVPPVRFPVMSSTMGCIIVGGMVMARMVVMRIGVSIMMGGGVVMPGVVMISRVVGGWYTLTPPVRMCRVMNPVSMVNMLLRMGVSSRRVLMHI